MITRSARLLLTFWFSYPGTELCELGELLCDLSSGEITGNGVVFCQNLFIEGQDKLEGALSKTAQPYLNICFVKLGFGSRQFPTGNFVSRIQQIG
jgi:hypothetical protein